MKETIRAAPVPASPEPGRARTPGSPHREHGRSVEGRAPWPVTLLLGKPAIERAAVKVRPKFGIQRGRVKPWGLNMANADHESLRFAFLAGCDWKRRIF